MQRTFLIFGLMLWASLAPAQRVVIIQGTTSLPDAAEKNYARRMAENMDRALQDFVPDRKTITDDKVNASALAGASVAILPYNAQLPDAEFSVLKQFVARGGKLIVFFCSDARLAQLMGFKLDAYQVTSKVGQWAAMRFADSAPPGMPPVVRQTSRNIRAAIPNRADARVIANWEDGAGKPGIHVAWVASPQGFWMAHVLLDDGDAWNKQCMLLALLAAGDPGLVTSAAKHYLATTAHYRNAPNFPASLQTIRQRTSGEPSDKLADALQQSAKLRGQAEAAFEAGKPADAIRLAHEAHLARVRAYGFTVPSRAGERVGIWDHSGAGLYLGDWDRTCAELQRHGITDLFVNLLWPHLAHYPSTVLPQSETFRVYGDQAAASLAAAHAHGLRLHAWKVCWQLNGAPADVVARFKSEGRLQQNDSGQTIPWLCPSDPRNLQFEKDAFRELLTRYDVDGVHLDYIRYDSSHACYCRGCRQRYEAFTGQPVGHWPSDVRSLPGQIRFEGWRAGRITRLVQDLNLFGRKLRPNIEISAAVYGRYPLCKRSVGQDWGQWLEKGWAEFVCPMDYTEDLIRFTAWTSEQTALPAGKARIWPGIGVTAAESHLDAVDVLDQIGILRRAGAGGFVLFDLNRSVADDILPVLSLSATRPGP